MCRSPDDRRAYARFDHAKDVNRNRVPDVSSAGRPANFPGGVIEGSAKLWGRTMLTKNILTALLLAIFPASFALASGYIPKADYQEKLKSHAACISKLQSAYDEHKKAALPKTVREDGSTREVTAHSRSNGIVTLSRSEARYDGEVWYHNGRKSEIDGQVEVSHSWDRREMHCKGRMLTEKGASGYTLSTFEKTE
jgi:hypothetical protein